MAGFQDIIKLIQDGEAVKAATPNRPLQQLDGNIRYLKDLLETALLGQANFIRDATVDAAVQVGQPVFFNATTLQFEQAIGAVESDTTTGFLKTAATSHVAGIVYRKLNSTKADILVSGFAEIDMSAAIDGTPAAGVYYLSNAEAGKLTSVLPPSGLPIVQLLQPGSSSGTWQVLLKPQFHDFLLDHRHYTYEMVALPAGDHAPPAPGGTHTITNADNTAEGWLPASDPVFGGKAPANAKFGYNLSVSSLKEVWPPVPLSGATLSLVKPEDPNVEDGITGAWVVPDDYVTIDENGIWWLSDCYNEVPWPTLLDTNSPTSVSASCPLPAEEVRLYLNWVASGFYTDQTAVLSLKGREGSGIVFYCRNTDDVAETGHLEADFDLNLLLDKDDEAGHLVFKTLGDGKFNRGPVVESIKSGSPELTVISDVELGANDEAYANITLKTNLDITNSEFPVDTVRLNGVEEEFYEEVIALGFPSDRPGDFRGRCVVPGQIAFPAGTTLKLQFWVLGRAAGTVPDNVFTLTYRILPQPASGGTQALPTSDSSLSLSAGATLSSADEYYVIESAAFNIAAGDQILFTLGRNAPDSYNGELHILRMRGIPVGP